MMNQPFPKTADNKVLYVTNITHSASDVDLADLFSVAGDVARSTVVLSGFPYHGFVEYFRPEDAKRALMFNGKFFGPSKISVGYSTQPFPSPTPLLGNAPSQMSGGKMVRTTRTEQERPYPGRDANSLPQLHGANNINTYGQTVQLNKPRLGNMHGPGFDVFLSNIPVDLKEHNLHQIFSEFGTVVDVDIVLDSSNLSTGRGKVQFASYESAMNAANSMDGKQLGHTNLRLGCYVQPPNESTAAVKSATMPVRDLRQSITSNHIRHHPYSMPPLQPIQQNNMMPPPQTMLPNQPMHQHFDPPNMAGSFGVPPAGSNMNMVGTSLGQQSSFNVHGESSHNLTPSPNAPVVQQQPAAVYVSNLPETSCKNCLLYQLFAPYGAISSVKPMDQRGPPEDKDGQKKTWFGFINFKDINQANIAILTLDKSSLDGNVLKVALKTEKPNFRNNFMPKQ